MQPRAMRWALATIAVCTGVACGDPEITGPSLAPASSVATYSADGGPSEVVAILKRTENQAAESVTGVIGPKGGYLQLKRSGMRIEFARGAVPTPTEITVTALPGREVAYNFEPHGLVFQAPVTISQNLRHTVAWKNPKLAAQLQGSYFAKLLVDPTRTYARRSEQRAAKLRDADRMLEFTIEHFSGYMISTGKAGVEIEIEIEVRSR